MTVPTTAYALAFDEIDEIDETLAAVVGGKGAGLAELARIDGVSVPPGFCVTTAAFARIMAEAPGIDDGLDRLARVEPGDRVTIGDLSAEVRALIEAVAVPQDVAAAISRQLIRFGERTAYAVRSSAQAEDLPTTSFAGQHDSYLNVVGPAAILQHVSRCCASLFTERAVTYRLRNGFDHRRVRTAVVVQQMVLPAAAGVLFTADPVTGNREIVSVEATFGLGEAVVSGRVNADVYTVRDGAIVAKAVGAKQLAVLAAPSGGTHEQAIEPARQEQPTLTDAQVLRLAELGRRIQRHAGSPQDVEWCLVGDDFHIVQSRPITTLFPVPAVDDREHHVYISVGHQQMMTDPMRPLGLSVWQLTSRAPMRTAGGRLFVDVTAGMASPASRAALLEAMGRSDPLIRDAMQTVVERGDFIPLRPDEGPGGPPAGDAPDPIPTDPAIVTELIAHNEASLAAMERDIAAKSGEELLDFIAADIHDELRRVLFAPQSHEAIMAGIEATWWLNDQLEVWLGEKNAADTLAQSVPHNITSEMGLALLDVADVIRPHPELVAFLRDLHDDDGFLDELATRPGGPASAAAIRTYLDSYGMRCVGEIDITRPRWAERPTTLVPVILGNVDNFEPGEAARRFERGRREAAEKERELLARLQALPDGASKAAETKRMIDRLRTFTGYREYPKYAMVSRYLVYKRALLADAARLVEDGVLREPEDIFFLTFEELHDVVRTREVDERLIRRRRDEFASYHALTPPRVLTSDGEIVTGAYRREDLPDGTLVGLPVSAGTIEGRARVVLDMAAARLEPGDILVTAFTDPSWSPLFVAVAGLVTEVGGLMTHGAVIAREYGLPAVVGVEHATQLIRDGQRIRVHGTDGYVELLDPPLT